MKKNKQLEEFADYVDRIIDLTNEIWIMGTLQKDMNRISKELTNTQREFYKWFKKQVCKK